MKIELLCAVMGGGDAGVREIEGVFRGTERLSSCVVPSLVVGGMSSLREVHKRYENAAPYGGPGPATIWRLAVPMTDPVDDPQRLRDLTMRMAREKQILDLWVGVHDFPEPQVELEKMRD